MPEPLVITGKDNIAAVVVLSAYSAAILLMQGIPMTAWQKKRIWTILFSHMHRPFTTSRKKRLALLRSMAGEFPIVARGLDGLK
jgi:hypothetical protein